MSDAVDVPALRERLDAMRERIAEAARSAGRQPDDITTVVVTKFQPLELVEALYGAGVRDFGESRHPEARDKAAALPADATWHFVGSLQTNKARQVRRYADLLHSVDRPELVDALAPVGEGLPVFLQVDLAGTPGRGGVAEADVERLAEHILAAGTLDLRGVMAVAPLGEDPARAFARLRDAAERVRALAPNAGAMSAGMSGDYWEAVAAGATHLRIGSAITGPRP